MGQSLHQKPRPTPSPEYKRQQQVVAEKLDKGGPFYEWKTKINNAGPGADWMAIEGAIREGKTASGVDLKFTNAHKQDLIKALKARKAEVQNLNLAAND